jgi:hypothetical protein
MNPKENPELTVQALMALRQESDALRVITERLRVKEMGPADHIRTKHEVKDFIATGDEAAAETLVRRATERREIGEKIALKISKSRGQRI